MKLKEVRAKTETELREQIKSMAKVIESHASEIIKGKEKNTSKVGFLKRDLARVKTVLNEKLFMKGSKDE